MNIVLKATKTNNNSNARTNQCFVNPKIFSALSPEHIISINGHLFLAASDINISENHIAFNKDQRCFLSVALEQEVQIKSYEINKNSFICTSAVFEVSNPQNQKIILKEQDLIKEWIKTFPNIPLNLNMTYYFKIEQTTLLVRVKHLEAIDASLNPISNPTHAFINVNDYKSIKFEKACDSSIIIETDENSGRSNSFFKQEWSFEEIGVGGLDKEFMTLFRRAFASRIYPSKIVKQMGMQHVKGILLYGPPGTGKTLMARQIGKMLNCVEPKIVNGPEIFDKMVGESEKHIRELFEEAEKDEIENGDNAQLHLIIMDEIDSICKKRGSTNNGTGVNDQVVNQLLTKIDGVNALNDVLLIGMTNRRDLIDEALLRPGRLEVQIEIHLPDENGRLQIFEIHTKTQRENKRLASDVNLKELATLTPNYTGAEIAGVVRSAVSFAMNKFIDMKDLQNSVAKADNITIDRECFINALNEVQPEFGIEEDILEKYVRHGCIIYSNSFAEKKNDMENHFIKTLINGKLIEKQVYLFYGKPGCGITSFAISLASNNDFNFIRIITPEKLIGLSESVVCSEILNIFTNAYKSLNAAIIINDLERIIEYSKIGPRYSNMILQAILTLIKASPPKGHKLGIFITTSQKDVLELIGVDSSYFDKEIELLPIQTFDEFIKVAESPELVIKELVITDKMDAANFLENHPMPIKRLIQILDMCDYETEEQFINWETVKSCITRFM